MRRSRRSTATVPGRRDRSASRAMAPAIAKAMEVTLLVLLLGLLTTTMYGGVVPDYRSQAATEVGERALAGAAHRIEGAVPPTSVAASARVRVDLPRTIRGDGYRVVAEDRSILLDHPRSDVSVRVPLALPRNASLRGAWRSDRVAWVVVERERRVVSVRLETGRKR